MDFEEEVAPYELTPFTLFAGDSGTGKSTILDVFAFLADCINHGINDALASRGGFESVYHLGGTGPLSLGITYRPCAEERALTYFLNIDRDQRTRHPFVETEAIVYRDHQTGGQPQPVLLFQNGDKRTRLVQPWTRASGSDLNQVKRTDASHLGLAALAPFEDLPDIPQLKLYLDKFFISNYLASNAANLSPPKFKTVPSGNLALELKRLKDKHPTDFAVILDVIAKRLPGVDKIKFEFSEAGRPLLSFDVAGYDAPIYPAQFGEGTLRLLSHLTLFEDPLPTPLLGIEEPAAFMGYSQIRAFVHLIQHHIRELGGTQFFATTHCNTLIDLVDPAEVWFLRRDDSGSVRVSRGLDELQFFNIDLNSEIPNWYSQYIYPVPETGALNSSILNKSSASAERGMP